ncbi:hypothetical protein D9619_013588 [Psilocybe cf. subviscida]|uniref:Protein-S-isoprenylcysteine O-methyltransferase n=1 Tax=Psilocybe cf. subviscida TaxID=2480587 RepID=A0A8H5EQX2_9AGAR|nr:hypothetical protein D9619_013588 [Psilocybe cf. subviscida]
MRCAPLLSSRFSSFAAAPALPSLDDMEHYEAIIQIALLVVTGAAVHLSLSPPNPSVKSEECCLGTQGTQTLFERVVQSVTYCSKSMVWLGVAFNVVATVIKSFRLHTTRQEALAWVEIIYPGSVATGSKIHLLMVAGALFAVCGAALRIWCFKSLGPLFTFEITIHPQHRLVVHGPYAWVRHPSYTGVFFTLTGASLVLAAPGTWSADSGIWTPLGAISLFIWVSKCLFAFRGMAVRYAVEDEVLRATFGTEWEDYAARVPYKFIPRVL